MERARETIRVGKISGAVGTFAHIPRSSIFKDKITRNKNKLLISALPCFLLLLPNEQGPLLEMFCLVGTTAQRDRDLPRAPTLHLVGHSVLLVSSSVGRVM